jgi:predicted nucleic acid-binding protein
MWRFEVANALQMAVRQERVDKAFRDRALVHLATLDISTDPESVSHAWSATVRLAEQHSLTVYDAAYLELADRRRMPLATLDKALIRAAAAESVRVIGNA